MVCGGGGGGGGAGPAAHLLQPAAEQPQQGSSICANLTRWALEHACGAHLANLSGARSSTIASTIASTSTSTDTSTSIGDSNGPPVATEHLRHEQQRLQQSLYGDADESPLTRLVTRHLQEPLGALEGKVNYYFSDIWLESGDERTNKLPFIGAGPWKLIYATLIYLLIIKWLLPRLMRPLKPLELTWPIRAYNLAMVASNIWAFYHGARILRFGLKCFGCETIDHADYSRQALELLHYGWLFLLSRLVEWLDTIFFVLRKRERQVTKLHVFHHSFVPLISWTYLKYHPGYTVAFFPFVNSFVHSIMYTYYLLATFGPKLAPYLWWKRYLTSLQIAQFVLILIQLTSIPLTGDETCHYPRGFLYVAFAGAILFLWLFYTYYRDTYRDTRARRSRRQCEHAPGAAEAAADKQQVTMGAIREGSSQALSEAIDNAIGTFDEPERGVASTRGHDERAKKFD